MFAYTLASYLGNAAGAMTIMDEHQEAQVYFYIESLTG